MRVPARDPLTEASVLTLHFLLFCGTESVPWTWHLMGRMPMTVTIGSHIVAAYAVVVMALLGAGQALRALRVARAEWRRTFPTRRPGVK